MMLMRRFAWRGVLAILVGWLAPALPAAAAAIGVTSAVLPQATGTPPQGDARILQVGIDVVANERIVTGGAGKTHLLFQDGSALTIGSNADVVLDEFVYDTRAKSGSIALSASKGVLRFVGGRISKSNPVQIRTPTATIGIRGGIAILAVGASAVTAKFLFGDQLTVSANGQSVTVTRPGFQVVIPFGAAPGQPTPIPAQDLTGSLGDLEGTSSQSGATAGAVSDNDVSGSQLGALGSTNVPTGIGPTDSGQAPLVEVGTSGLLVDVVEQQNEMDIGAGGTAPTFLGSEANVSVSVGGTLLPFATLQLVPGSAGLVTLVLSITDPTVGTFTAASLSAGGFTSLGSGIFFVTGSPDQVQAALQQLAFAPANGQLTTGQSASTQVILVVSSGESVSVALQTVTVSCAGVCINNTSGRVKSGASTATGTNGANQPFTSAGFVASGTNYQFSTSAGSFSLPLPTSTGNFTVSGATLPASFGGGPFSGTGFAAPGFEFLLYELTGSQILIFGGVPNTSFTPGTSFQAATYSLRNDFTTGNGTIPFIPKSLQTNVVNGISPTMTLLLGTPSGGDQFFMAGNLVIDGTASGQGMAGSLLLGLAQNNGAGTMFLNGLMRGTADAGSTGFVARRFAGPVATADDANGFDFFGSAGPRYAVLESANVNGSDVDQGGGGVQQLQGSASVGGTIFPNVPALNTASGLGTFTPAAGTANNQRTSRTISGYVGGVALRRDGNNQLVDAATFRSNRNPSPNAFSRFQVMTDTATNRINATMNLVSDQDGFSAGFDTTTIISFGGLSDAGRSGFLNNSTFAAVEGSGSQTVNSSSGSVTGLFITKNMVTFNGGAIPGSVTLCTCSELQWGFLAATLVDPGNAVYDIPLAQWVAGSPATTPQITGFTGNATYDGHVVASVINGAGNNLAAAQRYTAVGSMTLELAFSSGTLSVNSGSITLDGTTYTLSAPSPFLTAPEFEFDISGGSRSGSGIGAVYGSGTPPNQAGGNFSLAEGGISNSAATYAASGIFATDLTGTQIPQ